MSHKQHDRCPEWQSGLLRPAMPEEVPVADENERANGWAGDRRTQDRDRRRAPLKPEGSEHEPDSAGTDRFWRRFLQDRGASEATRVCGLRCWDIPPLNRQICGRPIRVFRLRRRLTAPCATVQQGIYNRVFWGKTAQQSDCPQTSVQPRSFRRNSPHL